MLHKCANPKCLNPFRKLSEGKLFPVEMKINNRTDRLRPGGKASHRIEHFWLCNECAAVLTLAFEPGRGVVTVPRREAAKKDAVAPLHLDEALGGVHREAQ
jgi:hypothetical protein